MNSYFQLVRNGYVYCGPRYLFSMKDCQPRRVSPNLFIIGAAKSGTTSLHYYLSRHGSVYMSFLKEPGLLLNADDKVARFWSEEEHSRDNRSNNHFRGDRTDFRLWLKCLKNYQGQRVIGEASTYYTFAPHMGTEVPAKVARSKTPAKLVYLVRDPWERILSHYHFDRRLGVSPDDFQLALRYKHLYLSVSLYWEQLAPYVRAVGKERIRVISTEQLKNETETVLRELFKFLEVDETDYDYSGLQVDMNKRESSAPHLNIPDWYVSAHRSRIMENVRGVEEFTGRSFGWSL